MSSKYFNNILFQILHCTKKQIILISNLCVFKSLTICCIMYMYMLLYLSVTSSLVIFKCRATLMIAFKINYPNTKTVSPLQPSYLRFLHTVKDVYLKHA